jgi:putative two-component system response regulator
MKGHTTPGAAMLGRIVAIADVFDALTQSRPYKDAWTVEDAVSEISAQSGRQFDPAVVEAFLHLLPSPVKDPRFINPLAGVSSA